MKRAFCLTLMALSIMLSSCEKDDICDANTATTPRMVIHFYDINNPTVLKNVTSLAIIGDGIENPISTFNNVSTASLPLRTDADLTTYRFILNSTDLNTDNEDRIAINYARNDIFVSRACGYKTLFVMDEAAPFVLDAATDGAWIQNITVVQPSIETEDETHLNIYF